MRSTAGRSREAVAAAIAVVLALSACSSPGAATARRPADAPVVSSAPSSPAAVPSPSASVADGEQTASPQDVTRGTAVATAAVRAFCRPQQAARVWFGELEPFLTADAVAAYSTVQPDRIACTRPTGAAVPRARDGFTQQVSVPTDAGDLRVTLQRPEARSGWLVSRIVVQERRSW